MNCCYLAISMIRFYGIFVHTVNAHFLKLKMQLCSKPCKFPFFCDIFVESVGGGNVGNSNSRKSISESELPIKLQH